MVQVTESPLNFTLVQASPAQVLTGGSPIYVEQGLAPQIHFLLVPPPQIEITVVGEVGPPGPSGPPGPPGPRGSLFLGGYPSFANLPIPDGVHVLAGDFALVQDESAIYELE